MAEAAIRRDIPLIMAGHHRPSWEMSELHNLISQAGLIKSEHYCCSLDVSFADRELSNAQVRVYSRPGIPSN